MLKELNTMNIILGEEDKFLPPINCKSPYVYDFLLEQKHHMKITIKEVMLK